MILLKNVLVYFSQSPYVLAREVKLGFSSDFHSNSQFSLKKRLFSKSNFFVCQKNFKLLVPNCYFSIFPFFSKRK